MKKTETGLVYLYGLTQEEAVAAMRAVKAALPQRDIAFSMATPHNLEWKVSAMVEEVLEEHEMMKKNPPSAPNPPAGDAEA